MKQKIILYSSIILLLIISIGIGARYLGSNNIKDLYIEDTQIGLHVGVPNGRESLIEGERSSLGIKVSSDVDSCIVNSDPVVNKLNGVVLEVQKYGDFGGTGIDGIIFNSINNQETTYSITANCGGDKKKISINVLPHKSTGVYIEIDFGSELGWIIGYDNAITYKYYNASEQDECVASHDLYDEQGNFLMNIRKSGPGDSKACGSGRSFSFELPENIKPGNYILKSTGDGFVGDTANVKIIDYISKEELRNYTNNQ